MAESFGWSRLATHAAIASLIASLCAARAASAADPDPLPAMAKAAVTELPRADIGEIPPECRVYAAGDAADLTTAWNRLLSFAACVQDASVERITDPAQLPAMVGRRYDALAPAIVLYLEAIEHGPAPVRLRAAYAVGLANIALVTRLRSSLVAPRDPENAAAMARYHALQAGLEPLLLRAQRTAWIAFTVVDQAAAQDPAIAADPATRHVVAAARAMLQVLGGAARDLLRPGTGRAAIVATR